MDEAERSPLVLYMREHLYYLPHRTHAPRRSGSIVGHGERSSPCACRVLTEAAIGFGRRVVKIAFRVDLSDVLRETHAGPHFAVAMRLLDNFWRDMYALIAWVALWVIAWVIWIIGSFSLRPLSPTLGRAFIDLWAGVVSFVGTGFVLLTLRFGLLLSAARVEVRRVRQRMDSGDMAPRAASPLQHVIIYLTRPGDYDLLPALIVGVLVILILVSAARRQGFPL